MSDPNTSWKKFIPLIISPWIDIPILWDESDIIKIVQELNDNENDDDKESK